MYYQLQNIGQVSAGNPNLPPNYINSLFIDGQQVAEDNITEIIQPGQYLERSFKYNWTPNKPQHQVAVFADSQSSMPEANEQNNYLEKIITTALPDLVVEKIECTGTNNLSVTIRNIGTAGLPSGWGSNADVFFNGIIQGSFSLTAPTSTQNGGIASVNGSSSYLLPWKIKAEVKVLVIADAVNSIVESNEQNNSLAMALQPWLPDLVVGDPG